MVVLGIDPGYGRLGYAILEKKKDNLLDCGCVETNSKEKYTNRIKKIATKIESLIEKYKPNVLVIEKLFFTSNQKTALQVSEVKGIILYLAIKNGLKILELTPLQVKSHLCGDGRADKKQIQKMVDMVLKLDKKPKYDDTYDAIALCLSCPTKIDYI